MANNIISYDQRLDFEIFVDDLMEQVTTEAATKISLIVMFGMYGSFR